MFTRFDRMLALDNVSYSHSIVTMAVAYLVSFLRYSEIGLLVEDRDCIRRPC